MNIQRIARYAAVAAFGCIFCTPSAWATTVTWDYNDSISGQLAGASGVNVGGMLYDVAFIDGTCIEVFSGCNDAVEDLAFQNGIDALSAAEALRDQVFLNFGMSGSPANFDTDPSQTNGCLFSLNCQIFIPYQIGFLATTDVIAVGFLNRADESLDSTFTGSLLSPGTTFDTSGTVALGNQQVWAVFTSATPVPLPAGAWLFVSALGLLGWMRRRHA